MAAVPGRAAAPKRGLNLDVPAEPGLSLPAPAPRPRAPQARGFEPAPLPNREVDTPSGPRASTSPSVAPSLFTRSDQYRGDGFNKGSTSQSDQERRVRPGAGFSLKMPLTPQ